MPNGYNLMMTQAVNKSFYHLIFLVTAAALLLFEGTVALCYLLPLPSSAATSTDPADYADPEHFITVGEIHAANAGDSWQNVQQLYNLIVGHNNATLQEVTNLANTSKTSSGNLLDGYSAADIRATTDGNRDLRVYFGGALWNVCYLSTATNGHPILTLKYVSNAIKSSFHGDWAVPVHNKAINLGYVPAYGQSYIRAVTLNNGGNYIQGTDYDVSGERNYANATTVATASPSATNPFAKFTMADVTGSVTDCLVKPAAVSWQGVATGSENDYLWLNNHQEIGYYRSRYNANYELEQTIEEASLWGVTPDAISGYRIDYSEWYSDNVPGNNDSIYNSGKRLSGGGSTGSVFSYPFLVSGSSYDLDEVRSVHPSLHVDLTAPMVANTAHAIVTFSYVSDNPVPTVTLSGVTYGDDVQPVLQYTYHNDGVTSSTAPTSTSPVGAYTVTVTGLTGRDANKYILLGTTSFDFTITTNNYYDYSLSYAGTITIGDLLMMTPWYRPGMTLTCGRTIRNIGTYTINVLQDLGADGVQMDSVQLTIVPKQLPVALSGGGWVIGDSMRLPTTDQQITGLVAGDNVTVKVRYYDATNHEITNNEFVAGTYTAKLTLTGSDAANYRLAGTTTQAFTVAAPLAVTNQTDNFNWGWFTLAVLGGGGLTAVLAVAGTLIGRRRPHLV